MQACIFQDKSIFLKTVFRCHKINIVSIFQSKIFPGQSVIVCQSEEINKDCTVFRVSVDIYVKIKPVSLGEEEEGSFVEALEIFCRNR